MQPAGLLVVKVSMGAGLREIIVEKPESLMSMKLVLVLAGALEYVEDLLETKGLAFFVRILRPESLVRAQLLALLDKPL